MFTWLNAYVLGLPCGENSTILGSAVSIQYWLRQTDRLVKIHLNTGWVPHQRLPKFGLKINNLVKKWCGNCHPKF